MTTYKYKGLSPDGAKLSGVIKAYNEFEAVAQLRETCSVITKIEEVKETQSWNKQIGTKKIKDKELAIICSQFAIILTSGLPIVRCVEMVAAQARTKELQKMLKKVAEDVSGGYSLAQSFENNATGFPTTFIETVRAGEQSGTLEECFEKLHKYYDKTAKMKAKIISTLTYPAIVICVAVIVFIIIIGILVSYILVRKKGKVANLIDTLIMFPYVIPGSVLGIGLIVAFNRKPIILVGTAAIMIISYIIRKLPYTVRSGSAFLYQMDPFIEEASINLGVSPMKTFFTVTARMMLPGIMSGAVLSWITCINELSSSIMLYSGKTSTIAVAIYQEVVRMSDGTAAALATILTLTTIISLVIVFRATKGKVKIV